MADTEKGQRWPSTAELDLKRRLEEEQDEAARQSALQGGIGQVSEVSQRYATEDTDTSGYVGVSPEYMTYADDRQKPFRAEEGPEAEAEEKALQPGKVRAADVKEGEQTEGDGSRYETVTTATSGEDFTPDVAQTSNEDGGGYPTAAGLKPPAARKAPSAPAKPSGSGSTSTTNS